MTKMTNPTRGVRRAARTGRAAITSRLTVAGVDATLPLAAAPYTFISRRAAQLGTEVFQTRLLLRPTTFLTGADAARVFYDEDRLVRHRAAPRRLVATLFGAGGVQSLDGEAHRHRKAMFLSLVTPEALQRLTDITVQEWERRIPAWETRDAVVLLDEVAEILCRAVCRWAGVPLAPGEVPRVTAQLRALIEAAGTVGPRHWRGRAARARAERWAGRHIRSTRAHPAGPDGTAADGTAPDGTAVEGAVAEGTALPVIASHRDLAGDLLPARTAAVELLNVLRPTVAVAWYVTFAALALHSHPDQRERLRCDDDPELVESFVQEVRRYYPFFPFVAARAARDFDWHGHHVPAGRRVVLDLHGTNHDPRQWDHPDEFRPDRFRGRAADDFIPQGGGDHLGHRCAGEGITIALTKAAVTVLTRRITYAVPPQDLRIRPRRLPAAPRSGFTIDRIRRTG